MKLVDRFWPFMKSDYKAAESYLEAQSKKGLHIRHIDEYGIKATYEKAEPRNIKYCMDYLHLEDKEEAEAYEIMLKDAGWNYVADMDKYLIFASEEGANPTPINTDWQEEYRLTRKGLWRYEIPMGIIATIVFVLLFKLPVESTLTLEKICLEIFLWCLCGSGMLGLIHSLLYYWRTQRALNRNVPMTSRSLKNAKAWGRLHGFFGIAAGIGLYGRYFGVAYTHWVANELVAAYSLVTVLLASLSVIFLMSWMNNHLPKIVEKVISILLVSCILMGVIIYILAA